MGPAFRPHRPPSAKRSAPSSAVSDHNFTFERDIASIVEEAKLDRTYVLRTSLAREALDAAGTVRAYKGLARVERAFKGLARVERAFRSVKTLDIEVHPVFHWAEARARAHVLLRMLAYYLEWHMRQALTPILFDGQNRADAEARRNSPVAKASVSEPAQRKARTKQTDGGRPVHSFRSLIADLATLTSNKVRFGKGPNCDHPRNADPGAESRFRAARGRAGSEL